MPISGWQWAALMNDGPYNWCTQRSAWGSWISGVEHRAKLICFVRDGRRGEERLLSFRQEPSTWCQERRRCSSCCLCCNPTTPAPHSHTPPISSPLTTEHTPQHVRIGFLLVEALSNTHHKHPTYCPPTTQSLSFALTALCWINVNLSTCHPSLIARNIKKKKEI